MIYYLNSVRVQTVQKEDHSLKKAALFLLLIMLCAIVMPAAALDYTFISDLSQHKNKHLNILMPNAEGYTLQGSDADRYTSYSLALYDANGQKADRFPQEATLYFRLPSRVERDSLPYYAFTIEQTNGAYTKTYSTAEGTVLAHPQYGIGIKTDRPGDFKISFTVTDDIGPTWDELMELLEEADDNTAFDHDGIRVTRSGETLTFAGLHAGSRIRSDVFLDNGLYTLPGSKFVFDNVQLQEVYINPDEADDWTVHFTDSSAICFGVEAWLKAPASRVHLINDTVIRDLDEYLSQRDYPLVAEVPYGASFRLSGKGSIPADYCIWRTSTMEEVYKEQKSALINVFVQADSTQDAIPRFDKVFGDIELEPSQFPSGGIASCIRTCLVNETLDGSSYEIVYDDHPAVSSLSELNANQVGLLIPGSGDQADLTLKVSIHDQKGDQAIVYDLALVNDETQAATSITGSADLYLPYPQGMDMESAAQYDFTITHYTAYGEETFSTRDGSITLTPYGLCIRIHSMSPFLLSWEEAPVVSTDDLPQTGDNSKMALWLALLTLSGAAMLVFKRRAA